VVASVCRLGIANRVYKLHQLNTSAMIRAIKRRVNAKQGFREFQAARRTIQGYEAMHMIRKGQARWVGGSDVRRQIQFINRLFELTA
jgi:transposase-like protein